MKCDNCGNLVPSNDVFCPYCGYKLINNDNINDDQNNNNNNESNEGKYKKIIILVLLAIVALLLFIAALVVSSNGARNPEDYPGTSTADGSVDYQISDSGVVITNITDNSTKTKDRVIMVYMVGSNLESGSGEASADINEMLKANLDKHTHIYIFTGGSKFWYNNNIDANKNGIYEISNKKLVLKKSFDKLNMGDSKTLTGFINYVTKERKSDNYSLILWDHGGGPIVGYGNDELSGDSLKLDELYTSLKDSPFGKSKKLEFIGFDACLMGNYEVANYMSDYAKYIIASEEVEPGGGWDYNAFSNVSKLSTENLGKQIIDKYSDSTIYSFGGHTLSMLRLDNVSSTTKELNKAFKSLNGKLSSNYEKVARSRLNTLEFGKSSPDQSFDLIDLSDFINNYNDKSQFSKLSSSLEKMVVYAKSNLPKSRGISIFFPYTNGSYAKRFLELYSSFAAFSDYHKFIKNFDSIHRGESRTTWDFTSNRSDYTDSKLYIELTDEQTKNYSKANYVVFEKEEDNTYMPVYKGTNLKLSNNKLIAQYNKKILYVYGGKQKGTMTTVQVRDTNKGTLYYTPTVNMNYTNNKFESEMGWVRLLVSGDKVKEYGIVPNSDDLTQTTKIKWKLKDWDSVQFTNYRFYILDDNGNYTTDWKGTDTKYLFEVLPKKEKVAFKLGNFEKDKEYYAVINVLDLQGKTYHTNLIKIQ